MNEHRVHTVADIAGRVRGRAVGCASLEIEGVQSIDDAGPRDITFIVDAARARRFAETRAGAALISRGIAPPAFDDQTRALIEVDDADYAILDVLELFAEESECAPGVHESATIAPGARIAPSACIGPHVSIEAGSAIGERTVLHPGVRIGRNVSVGSDCILYHNAVVSGGSVIGNRVILHNGVSIGADGFNYRPRPEGRGLRKVAHLSHVVIEDDVEIGANSCVDRGKFSPTVIGAGTKIDNLVQIGHNCRIGRCVVIAGCAGIAGSVTIGDGAMIAGQAAVGDHLTIGPGAKVLGNSGVMRSLEPGEAVFGTPAQPRIQMLRQVGLLRKLKSWMDDVEARLRRLEGGK